LQEARRTSMLANGSLRQRQSVSSRTGKCGDATTLALGMLNHMPNAEETGASPDVSDNGNGEPKSKLAADLEKMLNKFKKQTQQNGKTYQVLKDAEHKAMKTQLYKWRDSMEQLTTERENLSDEVERLKALNRNLERKAAQKRGYSCESRKDEQREDVRPIIMKQVKKHLFRTRKFLRDEEEAMQATAMVYNNLREELRTGLDELDFCKIYHPLVSKYLSDQRQHVQNRLKKAAMSKCENDNCVG